ncbi:uncharacterized protein LOC123529858 isoform X2 [Mercenaria mercenaria]|uniref:uncharacterized protein LOC123529858 isoform X2 n=1 Tax=Mercenaria mercenaria TaxID=6596 RepID=UPI00234EA46E|nr:uncharacterized protein LOC123529858 isoform X2 [Mercenaria mercenaria]
MAERDAKRLKTQKDGSPRIFKTFKRDCVKSTDLLLSAVSALERGLEGLSFAMLKVDTSNAQKQHSFVDVSIEYSPWNMFGDEEPHSGCNIGALFSDGLEVLKSYADMDSPKVPKLNLVQRTALQNLLEFLSKKIGLENGWHGNTDIIFEGADVQVACMRDEEDQDDLSVSSMEMEASDFNFKDFKQIVAQTIVFSFLQKKTCGNKLKNSLIPGIGMSKKKLIVVFYDAENDILLSTKPILLFGDKEIVYSALVFLWLTLNYKEFCTGIPDALKEFKASFLPDPVLHQMYIERVERPLHIDHTKEEKAFPWSDKNVRTVVGKKPEVVLSDLSEDES